MVVLKACLVVARTAECWEDVQVVMSGAQKAVDWGEHWGNLWAAWWDDSTGLEMASLTVSKWVSILTGEWV